MWVCFLFVWILSHLLHIHSCQLSVTLAVCPSACLYYDQPVLTMSYFKLLPPGDVSSLCIFIAETNVSMTSIALVSRSFTLRFFQSSGSHSSLYTARLSLPTFQGEGRARQCHLTDFACHLPSAQPRCSSVPPPLPSWTRWAIKGTSDSECFSHVEVACVCLSGFSRPPLSKDPKFPWVQTHLRCCCVQTGCSLNRAWSRRGTNIVLFIFFKSSDPVSPSVTLHTPGEDRGMGIYLWNKTKSQWYR